MKTINATATAKTARIGPTITPTFVRDFVAADGVLLRKSETFVSSWYYHLGAKGDKIYLVILVESVEFNLYNVIPFNVKAVSFPP